MTKTYTDFIAAAAGLKGRRRPDSTWWTAWVREMETEADAQRVLAVCVAFSVDGNIDRAIAFEAIEHNKSLT